MKRGIFRRGLLAVGSAALIVLAGSPSLGQVPKTGGVLSLRLREDLPQGFAINGELAERWSWQESYRKLVFLLRTDVKWHDGKPFTSKDVKHTFDLLREAPDAPAKLRLNPRREWYANVESIDAVDPQTVAFRLKRPQPSLLLMLASGFTPIYAAHVPAASNRRKARSLR